jgi:hypothetical protein
MISGDTPITAYSPFLDGPMMDQDAELAARRDRHAKFEAFTAECMKEAGFTYHPEEYSPLDASDKRSFDQDWMWIPELPSERADVELHGYGASGDEPFFELPSVSEPTTAGTQANLDYVAGLSSDAYAAYYLALVGHEDTVEGFYGEWELGCRGEAAIAVPEVEAPPAVEYFRTTYWPVAAEINQLYASGITSDPRIKELNSAWNDCMLGLGVDISSQVISGWEGSYLSMPSPSVSFLYAQAVETTDGSTTEPGLPGGDGVLRGTPAEAKIALADFDCRVETDYVARYQAIQIEVEQAFVNSRKEILDQMVAYVEQNS